MAEDTPAIKDTPTSDGPARQQLKEELKHAFVDQFDDLDAKTKGFLYKKLIGSQVGIKSTTYYAEKYALEIIEDIRLLIPDIATREITLFYALEDYPQWRPNTLRMYVTNAFAYICEHLDTKENIFKKLRELVEVQSTKLGVKIKWKKSEAQSKLKARVLKNDVDVETEESNYMQEIMNFMETATQKGEKYEIKDLSLSEADIASINAIFNESEIFGGIATKNSIMIRKLM